MLSKTVRNTVAILFVALLLQGCSSTATGQQPAPSAPAPKKRVGPRVVVYLLDITMENSLEQMTEAAARDLEAAARPGDHWYFRCVNNRSYSEMAAIQTLVCPPPLPGRPNPYDRRSQARHYLHQEELRRKIAEATQKLRTYRPARPVGTDICGAVAKSAELFAAANPDVQKELVLVSDLGDTESRPGEIDLTGVRVTMVLFRTGEDVKAVQGRRDEWLARFKEWKAGEVRTVESADAFSRPIFGTAAR